LVTFKLDELHPNSYAGQEVPYLGARSNPDVGARQDEADAQYGSLGELECSINEHSEGAQIRDANRDLVGEALIADLELIVETITIR
jgi:hypothetical protein